MGGSCSWWSRGSGASEVVYLPHGWFLFLVVQGQWGFPVAHCLTGSDLSAHLFHLGLRVSVLPDGHFGWEPSAQGVFGFTPPGQTFSSLAHRLNSRSATAKARRADKVKMINLMMMLLPPLAPQPMALPQLRSSPLSHSLTSTESLMTTQKQISRRPKLRMPTATLLDLSPLLSQTAESRPPPIQLITRMDSSPR